ncbi:hypothetical protein AAY81_05405 [Denitrobacterium detoxificans]|uniref:GTP cyclohydrolase 1 type 2 homolog n=1 Tax=Denitrobacterium detoxificans TaxID=79604 RepID=A0A172RY80_9ACTN|nr:Nif3-like dinuclear metal center hexameric protein [Denitrobacterium detoxificans]ANE22652.1 hypothetical protein AAY81_05405 [Denitrobacterium detoxificans]SEO90894.1 Putative GTP cyclohydrolase 1 type 2, NIF3 family [Denitrobacterium detoxificans]
MVNSTKSSTNGAHDLAPVHAETLSVPGTGSFTVGDIERALLSLFPKNQAESWDKMGLLVGDPSVRVTNVGIALDPTLSAVRQAHRMGCQLLLTHHPVFIEAPESFTPASQSVVSPGSVVFEAARLGVALMNFHTALDVNPRVPQLISSMLGLSFQGIVDVVYPESQRGYGHLCYPNEESITLRTLAARCVSVFGRIPRVWGDFDMRVQSVVTCTGSQGDLAQICVERGHDVLICGEIRYHDALPAAEAGLGIIELGHDVSELPLCLVLADALEEIGMARTAMHIIDQNCNWLTPEAVRK